MKIALTLVMVLFVSARALLAAEPATPEQVVGLYFKDMVEGGMAAGARRMHSKELEKFRKMLLPAIEEGFRKQENPDVLKAFTNGDTLDQVRKYSPEKFYQRFMDWFGALSPGIDDILRKAQITPIGHVTEGETVHVVYRMNVEVKGAKITKLSVVSLKKDGNEWRLLLTGEIQGMANLFKQKAGSSVDE